MEGSSATDDKVFVSAQELTDLSEDLAVQVAKSGFVPDFMIALWRGGCHIGAVVQEFLEKAYDSKIDHVAVRTISRDPTTGTQLPEIQVHAAGHATTVLQATSRLLIVDDVWDSGRSIAALLKYLRTTLGDRMPNDVRIATVYYKPKRNAFLPLKPDYFVRESDEWLVFPHELTELTQADIVKFRPRAYRLLSELVEI
jgi:hypoxanthine phosphoribosyltransferase